MHTIKSDLLVIIYFKSIYVYCSQLQHTDLYNTCMVAVNVPQKPVAPVTWNWKSAVGATTTVAELVLPEK